jgi:AcrR family transcriptional regulator
MERIADIRRREILESYYQVVSKEGIEGSSIAKIAKLMGVQPGLITYYFKSKDEMTNELVDFVLSKYEEPYFYGLDETTDHKKGLHMLLDRIFGPNRVRFVDDGVFYSCYSLTFRNPRIKEQFDQMYGRFRALLTKELTLWTQAGVIQNIDVHNTANVIISLMEGLGYFEKMLDSRQFSDLRKSMKDMALRLLTG